MTRVLPRIGLAVAIVAIVGVLGALVVGVGSILAQGGVASDNPFASRSLYADPGSKAATAADSLLEAGDEADAEVVDRIAGVPTAIWVTPEKYPAGEVGSYVSDIADAAEKLGQSPVFTVYGVPNRDCGNFSGGGLSAEEYPVWVQEIADALTGGTAVVILEPDALALADECDNVDERLAEVGSAVDILAEAGLVVYIDAGHSNWGPAADMADLLDRAGVERARGFSTNVSNYNTTDLERAYAAEISGLTNGAHYVIDTGRNGNGSNGEWCNPPGRALGAAPAASRAGSAEDATLWVKPPGESDGPCNGGPTAGEWWNENALELAANAGW
ncbi:glycoside hydrolase family 6 protein [Herbiconiux sp. CPCC 203407]|uniref:Glucanase n=1 Tax=Herbiconiux oxytropis TaxID=2970915 RepID=A0AA41XIW0_9MICO|nr:glycoside hydrolase family 6 protein [Herbiconiux oxytropis]MCS5724226.1 glycoside hydrolase family 6 protein [Herbiconiux oxytropis]MCS5726835.1 glycoside hydrolase family 6 protein [Herbiconiux oxytropis]